jgi:hypothetical protein
MMAARIGTACLCCSQVVGACDHCGKFVNINDVIFCNVSYKDQHSYKHLCEPCRIELVKRRQELRDFIEEWGLEALIQVI